MALTIGRYSITVPLFMAPMAGVTDLPFRNQVRYWGAGLATSEMLASDIELWESSKSRTRLPDQRDPMPRPIQIAGADPEMMAIAAAQAERQGAGIIDINMGCPAKKVCRKAAGSALLENESLVGKILTAVVSSASVPVTLKIRTGPSPTNINAVRIAKIAEDTGIAALYVHGRTRTCRFKGHAEYQTIARVVESVKIPVIANGDIDCAKKAKTVLEKTSAAGLMIGRSALGRPWIFREIANELGFTRDPLPRSNEIRQSIIRHQQEIYEYYGDNKGLLLARKHMGWYLDECGLPDHWKKQFNTLTTPKQQTDKMEAALQYSHYRESAAAQEK